MIVEKQWIKLRLILINIVDAQNQILHDCNKNNELNECKNKKDAQNQIFQN